MKKIRFLLGSALIGVTMGVSAEPPVPAPADPPELEKARALHERALQTASIPPLTAYLRKLESWQQFFTQHGNPGGATAMAAEIVKVKDELSDAQNAAGLPAGATNQLAIESAEYGDFEHKRTMDVTQYFKDALDGNKPSVSVAQRDMTGASDPAPGYGKSVKLTYTINGKRKELLIKEGRDQVLTFRKDLR